jgi:hypothetical protein
VGSTKDKIISTCLFSPPPFWSKWKYWLNIRDQSFQEIVDHNIHVFMPCMDYTEFSPLQKLHLFSLIWGTCYYPNEECGDLFDRIDKSMLKRMYVCRCLNID